MTTVSKIRSIQGQKSLIFNVENSQVLEYNIRIKKISLVYDNDRPNSFRSFLSIFKARSLM